MHAVMRPDGAMVLVIEQFELPDVEDALTLFEDVAKELAPMGSARMNTKRSAN
jgi:hypothetical protein